MPIRTGNQSLENPNMSHNNTYVLLSNFSPRWPVPESLEGNTSQRITMGHYAFATAYVTNHSLEISTWK